MVWELGLGKVVSTKNLDVLLFKFYHGKSTWKKNHHLGRIYPPGHCLACCDTEAYFPMSLTRTAKLDPKRNYIFGYHPHGATLVSTILPWVVLTVRNWGGEIFPKR